MKIKLLKILLMNLPIIFITTQIISKEKIDFNSPFAVNYWEDELNNSGIKWTRINIGWSSVEPVKGEFKFDDFDKYVKKLCDLGLGIMPVLSHPPVWARRIPENYKPITEGVHKGWGDFPPNDLDAWGNYVYQTVKHFKDRIKYWEIWNEPNCELFFNGGTVDDYVELLKVAYVNAKKADPSCKIVGLGGTDAVYARKVFEKGGFKFMDVASIHIYNALGHPPEKGWYLPTIIDTKKVIDEFGEKKDIWITETGWPTNVGFCEGWLGISLDEQAKYLVRSIVLSLSLGVKRIFWFSARNGGEDITNFEHNQGLLYHNKTPKPSYFAYSNLIKMLEGSKFVKKIDVPKIYVYLFKKKNTGCFILWTIKKPIKINFVNLPEDIKIFDINGQEIKTTDLKFISGSPIYILTKKINEFEKIIKSQK